MFQSSAFQDPGFQQETLSGGYGQGYADAINNADRLRKLRDRVENLPEPVRAPIKRAVAIQDRTDRELSLILSLEGTNERLQQLYIDIMEQLYDAMIAEENERRERRALLEKARRAEEEEILLLLAASMVV